jgi:hypothetical protein
VSGLVEKVEIESIYKYVQVYLHAYHMPVKLISKKIFFILKLRGGGWGNIELVGF